MFFGGHLGDIRWQTGRSPRFRVSSLSDTCPSQSLAPLTQGPRPPPAPQGTTELGRGPTKEEQLSYVSSSPLWFPGSARRWQKPRRESHQEPNRPALRAQAPQPPELCGIKCPLMNHPAWGVLLQRPEQAETGLSAKLCKCEAEDKICF